MDLVFLFSLMAKKGRRLTKDGWGGPRVSSILAPAGESDSLNRPASSTRQGQTNLLPSSQLKGALTSSIRDPKKPRPLIFNRLTFSPDLCAESRTARNNKLKYAGDGSTTKSNDNDFGHSSRAEDEGVEVPATAAARDDSDDNSAGAASESSQNKSSR